MKGKLFGVGVGPGDPELITLKAVKTINWAAVVAVPGTVATASVAFKIAVQAVPGLAKKELAAIDMPMTKDEAVLEASHRSGADKVISYLKEGKDVAFLTLGDPTVYSTYLFIHRLVGQEGYETEIVNGIPSFCAVAAKLNQGLVEKSELLHIVPSSYQIEEALQLSGTKVLMKAGKKMKQVKQQLLEQECDASMIENCGMEDEKIYKSAEEIDENAGYYSLIIVKDKH